MYCLPYTVIVSLQEENEGKSTAKALWKLHKLTQ